MSPQFALLTLFLVLTLAPCGRAQEIIPLYPEGVPCDNPGETDEIVQREDIGAMVTHTRTPVLHHYAPVPRMATGGAIMIIPGGGYVIEAWGHEGIDIANRLTYEGLHVFLLRHRLPRNEPLPCKTHVALDDARRGIQTIRLLADSLGIGQDRVAVLGFSAGGHLTASASVHFIPGDSTTSIPASAFSSRPDASLPIYPVLIMDDTGAGHNGSRVSLLGEAEEQDPKLVGYYNLPERVHADVPPTFLVHASNDKGVVPENSLRYYSALVKHEVPASMHIFATGGHGFGSGKDSAGPVQNWLDLAVEWLTWRGIL
ncbi:MAG: alpha/beta hydrolase [Bacteroidota bacterium]